jgi:SLT domain-containing protein
VARLIGEAYVSIQAETAGFREEADVGVRRALGTLKPNLNIGAQVDQAAVIRSIAAVKAQLAAARLDDIDIGINFANGFQTMEQLRFSADTLAARLKNIPMSLDDSRALASSMKMMAAIDKLRKEIKNLDPNMNSAEFNAKFYALEVGVKDLESQLAHLDPNMDPDEALEVLAMLRLDASELSQRLGNLEIDANDTPMLLKQAQIQANLSTLAHQMVNMPMDADTLPIQAKILGVRASVEALDAELAKANLGNPVGPSYINPTSLAAANVNLETMADRLQNVNKYLRQSGDQAQASFGVMEAALSNVNSRFEKIRDTGIVSEDDIKALQDVNGDLMQLEKSSGLTAGGVDNLAHGFGILGRAIAAIKNTHIPLFGGALESLHLPAFLSQASGIHMLLEGVIEFTAIWGPATLAMTAFGVVAAQTVKQVYGQFTDMNTVASATGVQFSGLKGTFQDIENAVKPEVLQLWGDYLTLDGNNADHFSGIMQDVGRVLDNFGAKITTDLNSKTTSKFLDKASGDIAGLGDAFIQVGRIIGTLLNAVPGYAQDLLKVGDAALTVAADVTQFLEPAIAIFLKFHGAIFYLGLATTAVLVFGRAVAAAAITKGLGTMAESLTGFAGSAASWATDFTSDNEKVAEAAGNSGSKLSKWGQGLGNLLGGLVGSFARAGLGVKNYFAAFSDATEGLSIGEKAAFGASEATTMFTNAAAKIPGVSKDADGGLKILGTAMSGLDFGVAGIAVGALAAVIGGVLYFSMRETTPEVTKFSNAMQALVQSSNVVNVQQNIASAITQTTQQMDAQQKNAAALGKEYTTLAESSTAKVVKGQVEIQNSNAETASKMHDNIEAQQQAAGAVQQYQQQLQGLIGQSQTAEAHTVGLTAKYGSLHNVMTLINLAGVNQNDIVKATSAQWAQDLQKINATAAAYGFMGQQSGAAGGQLNALAIQSGTTTKAVQNLTQAETAWISLVTGGDSGFDSYEQGFSQLSAAMDKNSKAATTETVKVGGLSEKFSVYNGTLSGTTQSSLAARSAFDDQLQSGVALFGNLQTLAAAAGSTTKANAELREGGKAIVAQLLPFAAGSKQATAELSSLAQLMGGPATDNFQTLAKWVGNTKGAEDTLNKSQYNLTIGASNLTTAAKNLAGALENDVAGGEAAAIEQTLGFQRTQDELATALEKTHGKITNASTALAVQYYNSLLRAGDGTGQAKQDVDAFLTKLGATPASVAKVNAALATLPSKVPINVVETLTGGGGLKATVTGLEALIHPVGTLSPGLIGTKSAGDFASGGFVHGSGPAGQDGPIARVAPGELIIPTSHAAKYASQAKADGIPGFASGGFVGDPNAVPGNALAGASAASKAALQATANAMTQFAANVNNQTQTAGVAGVTGNVKSYEPDVIKAMTMLGIPMGDLASILAQMTTESNGVANAVNHWDSNAKAGHPSTGLMQVIAGTFAEYAGPFRNIGPFENGVSINPLANIYAGLNYAVHAYGLNNLSSVLGHGHGYSAGGVLPEKVIGQGMTSGGLYSFGSGEHVSPLGTASTSGPQQQGATQTQMMMLIQLIQAQNKLMQQAPSQTARNMRAGAAAGANHGAYAAGR